MMNFEKKLILCWWLRDGNSDRERGGEAQWASEGDGIIGSGCGARTGQEGTGASSTRRQPRGGLAAVSRGRAWLAARSARLGVRGTLSPAEPPRHAQPR
nr:hypothetical protein Iba_chr01eCG9110 [Ipomoea batatas]GMC79773.1 hypothetical protein Iba_scaffold62857CG0010 [Ipomoea batatas]